MGEEGDSGLYVVDNGAEFSLTPLNKRKSVFESRSSASAKGDRAKAGRDKQKKRSSKQHERRTSGELREEEVYYTGGEGVVYSRAGSASRPPLDLEVMDDPVNYVRSANIPYIEEERGVLKSINVVHSVKKKFLQT